MSDAIDLWETPQADEIYMIVGWRQWADAGSVSSALPSYLIRETEARHIGNLKPDGFYLFQIPGTHHLIRPVVKFEQGFPRALDTQRNEFYFTGDSKRGLLFFLGDEPHLDAERYVGSVLDVAKQFKVKRIIGLGGVYGELPYDKERMISSSYSMHYLKDELLELGVNLSDYQGGASIGSYFTRRAGEREIEYVSFHAFVPSYDFTGYEEIGNTIRIENDFMAWLGIMRRINHMLKLDFDLADLEKRSERLIKVVQAKVDELEAKAPQLGVRDYMSRLADGFEEVVFQPLGAVWEDEFRRLFEEGDEEE
ncbi:MAG: PAC2 family protein [Anaerolineales bacterium]|nr:PAC2 family protein [Anaerolineales bacterium]MCB0017541.1 PAC2 family protein [Anaerolineales bacterium]MCB0028750.1 PAC2 family protein [Anaerolineales bacterium]